MCPHRCRYAILLAFMWTCGHAYNCPFKHGSIYKTLHVACGHGFAHTCGIWLHMSISMDSYMHASICAYIHVCRCMLMCGDASIFRASMHTHCNKCAMHMCIHANMRSCKDACMQTCLHANMRTCKHACIHTCIYKHTFAVKFNLGYNYQIQ